MNCPTDPTHLIDEFETCLTGKTKKVVIGKFFCSDCERIYSIESKGFNDVD